MAEQIDSVVICPLCRAETHRYPVTGNVECYTRGCPMRGVEVERRIMAGLSYRPPSDVPTRAIRIAVAYFDDPGDESVAVSNGNLDDDELAIEAVKSDYADGHAPAVAFINARLPLLPLPVEVEGQVDA